MKENRYFSWWNNIVYYTFIYNMWPYIIIFRIVQLEVILFLYWMSRIVHIFSVMVSFKQNETVFTMFAVQMYILHQRLLSVNDWWMVYYLTCRLLINYNYITSSQVLELFYFSKARNNFVFIHLLNYYTLFWLLPQFGWQVWNCRSLKKNFSIICWMMMEYSIFR